MKKLLYIFILLLVTAACGKIPRGILDPGKMEEVLYDYHLTQAMLENLTTEEKGDNNQRYVDAVFRKHGITQEQFDTSMVWYNGHEKYLSEIYASINSRFTTLDEQMKLKTGGEVAGFATTGDTANVWTDRDLFILRPVASKNKKLFSIKNDSTFYRGDIITLHATLAFVKDNTKSDIRTSVNIGFTVEYTDGKRIGNNYTQDYNDKMSLRLETDKEKDIKSVSGYFYYDGSSDMRNLCFIRDIALVRMHTQPKEATQVAVADSVESDSALDMAVKADTMPHKRLSPTELRQQTKKDDDDQPSQILTAPAVRTRNSYGPTRRKKPTQKKQ